MGHRLSKIYTRTGDEGTTGLGDGARVKKHAPRVHALGDVDELNTTLGLLLAEPLPDTLAQRLLEIQHDLFDLGGELSIPGMSLLPADAIARLEGFIDEYNDSLPPLALGLSRWTLTMETPCRSETPAVNSSMMFR